MGLFQHLLETYERCSDAAGIAPADADGNLSEKKTLLPVFHMGFKSEIAVTIDASGRFICAERDSQKRDIIIPCTEKSSGRSSGAAAHPLCDQLDYVGGLNEKKAENYLAGLQSWKGSDCTLNAIYAYVAGKTMIADFMHRDIFKDSEYAGNEADRQPDTEKIRKIGVRFAVQSGHGLVKVWEDKGLRDAWIAHIGGSAAQGEDFDYLSGSRISQVASQHPKNINAMTGNAKLLSCNDTSGFTFRGRFAQQNDAVLVDYVNAQKMHQMLRWLIANYGYAVDSQVIVTWAVDNCTEVAAKAQGSSPILFGAMQNIKTDTDILEETDGQVYADYAKKLRQLLQGYGEAGGIKQHKRRICIAAFDAATTGRMGLVFYQEMPENAYLETLVNWHSDTSYFLTAWRKEEGKNIPIRYVGAPSYDDILFALYGKPPGGKNAAYNTLKKKVRKQLLECMFGHFAFPKSMVDMAAIRASQPLSFTDTTGKFSENDWQRSIGITCALIRKYHKQKTKEEIPLELDTSRTDRDYLYGRLLSVANRLEYIALRKAGKEKDRITNAAKLMAAFRIKPYSTWGLLDGYLIPYKNQLTGEEHFKKQIYLQGLIDSILVLFREGEYEKNDPLSPLYLLGYAAQNRAFFSEKTIKSEGKDNDGNAE